MDLQDLPIVVIDNIVSNLALSAGFYETLLLRRVGKIFNSAVIRCLFHTPLIDYFSPVNGPHAIKFPPRLMAHFLLGQALRRGKDNSLLTAIWTALEWVFPNQRIAHTDETALLICEAALRHHGERECFYILAYMGDGRNMPEDDSDPETFEPTVGVDDVESYRLSASIISGDHEKVLQILTGRDGASDFDLTEGNGYFGWPLDLAARLGRIEIARTLLSRGAGKTLAAHTRVPDREEIQVWFLPKERISKTRGATPLEIACAAGHEDMARLLLKETESAKIPIERGYMVLLVHAAAHGGNIEIVKLLLSKIDPEMATSDFLEHLHKRIFFIAAHTHNIEMLQWMIDCRVDVNSILEIPTIPRGALCGSFKIQQSALGFAINPPTHSSHRRRFAVVKLLLEAGADPNLTERRLAGAVSQAIWIGSIEIVELLLKYGAKEYLSARNKDLSGQTSFFVAAVQNKNIPLARYFLSRGHDVNQPSRKPGIEVGNKVITYSDGEQAMMPAARQGTPEMVEFLVREAGVAVNHPIVDLDPVYYAMRNSNVRVLQTLYRLGAKEVDPLMSSEREGWESGRLPYTYYRQEVGAFGV